MQIVKEFIASSLNGYTDNTGIGVTNSPMNFSAESWTTQATGETFTLTSTGVRVPSAGVYMFTFRSRNDIAGRPWWLAMNGTRIMGAQSPHEANVYQQSTGVMRMTANQEFQIRRDGGASHPQSFPQFTITKISN